jgi:hypothetical protein
MQLGPASQALRSRRARGALVTAALTIALLPVLVAAAVSGVVVGEQEAGCAAAGSVNAPAGGGPAAQGEFAAPLALTAGRSYRVGATQYGGPGDPTSGAYGSIPDPGQSHLPSHPDSFAELSVLDSNPANSGSFTFSDADALSRLPYMTALRVSSAGRSELLYKRDTGYGQGPGQAIDNGQPYRLDLWWQAARALGVSKSAVNVELAPSTGSAAAQGLLTGAVQSLPGEAAAGVSCPLAGGLGGAPLPLTPGGRTSILASGVAAAGEEAPVAIKAMVAAGNRLHDATYLYGGAHGASLQTLQSAYDCSSAVSYLLHWGGALGPGALDSTALESYGRAGPGRWVSIYANAAHTFMYVGGLRMDTVDDPAYDSGPNSGRPGPRWRVSPSVPAWASWIIRHPPGL